MTPAAFGTTDAAAAASTVSVDAQISSNGIHLSMELCCCRHFAYGSCARSPLTPAVQMASVLNIALEMTSKNKPFACSAKTKSVLTRLFEYYSVVLAMELNLSLIHI